MNKNPWIILPACVALLALALAAPLRAELAPEDMLKAAKKNMQDRTWKVEVNVQGEHSMTVSGLIHEQDFDLTVKTEVGQSRQIAIGQKSWMTKDGGKTWKTNPYPDRRFYFLTHAPINYQADEKIPPFEKVDRAGDNIPGTVHVRLINEAPISYEGDRSNDWIKLKDDGSADVIVRSFSPLVFANDYVPANVHYTPADGEKIVPPPGNAAAVPAVSASDAMLAAALKRMEQGLWEVDCKVEFKKKARVRGLLGWEDFDLNMDPKDGNATAVHGIRLNGTNWGSLNEGKTWKIEPPDDVAIYNWVHSPLISKASTPPFEEAGREEHEGETWVKLRLKVEENITDRDELPTYWIALDKSGQPSGVRRYTGYGIRAGEPQNAIKYDISYRPAASDAAIVPPPQELIANAPKPGKAPAKTDEALAPKPARPLAPKVIKLIGGAKLKFSLPNDFTLDAKKKGSGKEDDKTIATFSRKDGVWLTITRGTHGLTPEGLQSYMDKRVAEYTEKLPKDLDGADVFWIRHEIVKDGARSHADIRFVPTLKGSKPPTEPKDWERNPLYTRFWTTSYKGQLLELVFSANLNTDPETKAMMDQAMDSVKLEE
jgi:hypothetical protein